MRGRQTAEDNLLRSSAEFSMANGQLQQIEHLLKTYPIHLPSADADIITVVHRIINDRVDSQEVIRHMKAANDARSAKLLEMQMKYRQNEIDLNKCRTENDSLNIIANDKHNESQRMAHKLKSIMFELTEHRQMKQHVHKLEMQLKCLIDQHRINESIKFSESKILFRSQNQIDDCPRLKTFDMDRIKTVLRKCANSKAVNLDPLESCIKSLKMELTELNSIIGNTTASNAGGKMMTLMDELNQCNGK